MSVSRESELHLRKKTRLACTRAKWKQTYTVKTMLLKRQLCPLSRDTLVLESHFPKTQEDLKIYPSVGGVREAHTL